MKDNIIKLYIIFFSRIILIIFFNSHEIFKKNYNLRWKEYYIHRPIYKIKSQYKIIIIS